MCGFDLDIYIASVSSAHNVAAKGYTVAIVSTIIETSTPEREIAPGLQLLGPILEKYAIMLTGLNPPPPVSCSLTLYFRFVSITPQYTPTTSGKEDNIFITKSYDATSHFETVVDDVKDVWERVMGGQSRSTLLCVLGQFV